MGGHREPDSHSDTVDVHLEPFLNDADAAFDPVHFMTRAAGHDSGTGCFTGREAELATLSRWLDEETGDHPLWVVTGSPGVGKSALLGVLVCAAHPRLRRRTLALWSPAAYRPSANDRMVVAHARRRGTAQIFGSLAGQLGLPVAFDAQTFIEAIADLSAQPVIVVDALDEANQAPALTADLLTLSRARRMDGAPLCRLLVGMRPEPEFQALYEAAARAGGLIDLDRLPRSQVRTEIQRYVDSVLQLSAPYDTAPYAAARTAFAAAVAAVLAEDPARTNRWGEYLVAALYTHHLRTRTAPIKAPDAAAAFGQEVPRTLPEVLELELSDAPSRRPVFTALSYACGEGMPLRVLESLVPLFGTPPGALQDVLDQVRFYLRQGTDDDGTTLYRLFHQGVADHLRPAGMDDEVLDRLLPASWDRASRYVRRYAIQHAAAAGRTDALITDPEFLVHADPATLLPELPAARADAARIAAAVYRTSAHRHWSVDTRSRRQALAIDAARHGSPELARRLAGPLRWRPWWATGSQVSSGLRLVLSTAGPTAICVSLPDREAVLIQTADRASLWTLRDLTSGERIGRPFGDGRPAASAACTKPERLPIAAVGDHLGVIRFWDLTDGTSMGAPIIAHTDAVNSLAIARLDGLPVLVSGSSDGSVRLWELTGRSILGGPLLHQDEPITTVDCVEHQQTQWAVIGSAKGALWIWDLTQGTRVHRLPPGPGFLNALVCTALSGRPLAILGYETEAGTGILSVLDLLLGSRTDLVDVRTPITAVACTEIGGRGVMVVGTGDGVVQVRDLVSATALGAPLLGHTGRVQSVVCHRVRDRLIAVTTGGDGTARAWDLTRFEDIDASPQIGHEGRIAALACAEAEEGPIAITAAEKELTIWPVVTVGSPRPEQLSITPDIPVRALACARVAGRSTLLSWSEDGLLRLWDLGARRELRSVRCDDPVRALAWTRIGMRTLAVIGIDDRSRGLRLWDPLSGMWAAEYDIPAIALASCPGLGGRGVVVALEPDGVARILDLGASAPVPHALGGGGITAIACTRAARRNIAVAGTGHGDLRIWNLRTGEENNPPLTGHNAQIIAIGCARTAEHTIAVTAAADSTVRIWDLTKRHCMETITTPEPAQALSLITGSAIVLAMNRELLVFHAAHAPARHG